jgi:hypothetical protein
MEERLYVVKNWCDDIDDTPGVYGKIFISRQAAIDFMVTQFREFTQENEIDLSDVDSDVDANEGTAHVDFYGCVHYWEVEEVAIVK